MDDNLGTSDQEKRLETVITIGEPADKDQIYVSCGSWNVGRHDSKEFLKEYREDPGKAVDKMEMKEIRKEMRSMADQINFLTAKMKEVDKFYSKLTE